jgi:hypothetical protein
MIECPWCSNEVEIKDGKCPRCNNKLDVVTEEDFQVADSDMTVEEGEMLRYKKLIEAIRLYGGLAIGVYMAFTGNIVVGFSLALILGLIDQLFVKPYLKPKDKK